MSGITNVNTDGGGGGSSTPPNTVTRTYVPGVQVGDVVYQTLAGSVDRASATSLATTPAIGVILSLDTPLTGQCYVLNDGDMAGYSGLVPGEVYILSLAPGQFIWESNTGNINYPHTAGNIIQPIGIAMSPSVLLVNVEDIEEL